MTFSNDLDPIRISTNKNGMKKEQHPLSYYLRGYTIKVEKELRWGSSQEWRHQDFISLSDKIYAKTGVQLSVNTLKRIWGKISYEGTPTTQTLDALAHFLGFENWLSFKNNYSIETERTLSVSEIYVEKQKRKFKSWPNYSLPILLLATLFVIGIVFAFQDKKDTFSPAELDAVSFTYRSVTEGVPNTVVFNYDVSHLEVNNVEIQQSWDERRRFKVPSDQKEATSFYYFPGHWRAKLLVNGQIIKEKEIFIPTQGWVTTLGGQDGPPRYFFEDELLPQNYIGVDPEVLKEVYGQESPKWQCYHYFKDFGSIKSDHFSLEARFKNSYFTGNNPCQETYLWIVGDNGLFSIPFSNPGCVGLLELWLNENIIDGKDRDLSAFGCNFQEWQHLRFEVKNKEAKIYLNGHLIHSGSYSDPVGKFLGFRFEFMGAGIIDDVRVWDGENKLIFEETFEN